MVIGCHVLWKLDLKNMQKHCHLNVAVLQSETYRTKGHASPERFHRFLLADDFAGGKTVSLKAHVD